MLLGCGAIELAVRRVSFAAVAAVPVTIATGGLLSLAWVAFKVGALSYGGGFVIVPLMQNDAVNHYHWMTGGQFLNAVALGQITPGPVVQTVAVVGYAAAGVGGGLLAAAVAFSPSFAFILLGGDRFDRIRARRAGAHVPRRRRPRGDRRHPRLGDPARARAVASRGSTASSPVRPCSCSRYAAASSRRWSSPGRRASPSPSSAVRSRTERRPCIIPIG